MIRVTADLSRFQIELRYLGAQAPLAAARALNRSGSSVQTAAVRAVAGDLKIAQKDVRPAMRLERATARSLVARLVVTGKRIALYAFRARQTRQGVTYDLGRGRRVALGAFIARMGTGHVGVFRRRTAKRLPLSRELMGPSLPHVFTAAAIAAERERLAHELLQKNLRHEIAFLGRRAA